MDSIFYSVATHEQIESIADKYITLLPKEEIDKSETFSNLSRKQGFLYSRILLALLCKNLNITFKPFEYEEKGKPFWTEGPYFSISHTEKFIAVALCTDQVVGIDIENTATQRDWKQLSRMLFSEQEKKQHSIEKFEDKDFFKFWTAKEAYLKMTGEGISYGLKKIVYNPSSQVLTDIARDLSFKINGLTHHNQQSIISICYKTPTNCLRKQIETLL